MKRWKGGKVEWWGEGVGLVAARLMLLHVFAALCFAFCRNGLIKGCKRNKVRSQRKALEKFEERDSITQSSKNGII